MGMSAAKVASSGSHDRRKTVESALAGFDRRPPRRAVPPEGRLGPADFPIHRLRGALTGLGPVFASFGRYLSTRPDLLPRRDREELAQIADTASPTPPAALEAFLRRQLGAPPSKRFFQFDSVARDMTMWTERHEAWVSPGVPAIVTVVRPDAEGWIAGDLPLLSLLQPYLGVESVAWDDAVADFARTVRARLDQTVQAASLTMLAAHAEPGAFAAPGCYHDHSARGVLTLDRWDAPTVEELTATGSALTQDGRRDLANRIATTWLNQALNGRLIPFDFEPRHVVVDGDRLILTAAVCDPLGSADRERLSRYLSAVAADDPEAAAGWLVDALPTPPDGSVLEEEVRRRFRQAVPFRDGEWSGDDRFAENAFVQWRVAREAGWRFVPQQLHVYRGLMSVDAVSRTLAPDEDVVLSAFHDVRLRRGISEAATVFDPATMGVRFDAALREMVNLPQKLDEVLTLAAEGRLRVKLHVPETKGDRRVRYQTILLVANLVVFAAIVSLVRHFAPAYGPGLERIGVVALLIVGGWLLLAAARL